MAVYLDTLKTIIEWNHQNGHLSIEPSTSKIQLSTTPPSEEFLQQIAKTVATALDALNVATTTAKLEFFESLKVSFAKNRQNVEQLLIAIKVWYLGNEKLTALASLVGNSEKRRSFLFRQFQNKESIRLAQDIEKLKDLVSCMLQANFEPHVGLTGCNVISLFTFSQNNEVRRELYHLYSSKSGAIGAIVLFKITTNPQERYSKEIENDNYHTYTTLYSPDRDYVYLDVVPQIENREGQYLADELIAKVFHRVRPGKLSRYTTQNCVQINQEPSFIFPEVLHITHPFLLNDQGV